MSFRLAQGQTKQIIQENATALDLVRRLALLSSDFATMSLWLSSTLRQPRGSLLVRAPLIATRVSFRAESRFPSNQPRQSRQYTELSLNTGARIPALGFGTWQDGEAQEQAVLKALQTGYRHIDGARM